MGLSSFSRIHSEPRFIATLSESGSTGLIRIPIALTGKWKGGEQEFSIDLDDLEEIRQNFANKPTGEVNVDYEHSSEVPFGTGGPVLSAGRIVKLDAPEALDGTGKYILWGWYEPTDRARALIQSREYRHVSPAIRWGAKDKVTGKIQGTTLTSVALVNKPFLEGLPDIRLSELTCGGKIMHSESEPSNSTLMSEVRAVSEAKGCSWAVALCEVAKGNPQLWEAYSAEVMVEPHGGSRGAETELVEEMQAHAQTYSCSLSEALSEVARRRPTLWRRHQEEIATTI